MNRTILIVDDETSILRSLSRRLRLEGYDVHTAASGLEGLELLKQHEIPVVLSDQRMPHMSGSQFLAEVKGRYPNTIRMMLSGYADFNAVSDAINDGGIYKFLCKPWDEASLFTHLDEAFERYQKIIKQAQASKLVKGAIEAVMVTDKDGFIESINTSFSLITEYDEQDAVHNKLSLFDMQREDDARIAEINAVLLEFRAWQGEVWLRQKSGRSIPVFMSIAAVPGKSDDVLQYTYSFIDISQEKAQETELAYQASHDMVTGLINRDTFCEQLSEAIFNLDQKQAGLAVVFIDIDRFKQINEICGYHAGDLALEKVGQSLQAWQVDGKVVARLGGDQFAIFFPYALGDDIEHKLVELKKYFDQPISVQGNDIYLMISVGASLFGKEGVTATDLMRNANTALYHSKKLGLNLHHFYVNTMRSEMKNQLILENDIRKAIQNEEFVVYFQPKLDLLSNRIVGAEALIRWNHPEFGLVSPKEFISLCEQSGLIHEVEMQMMKMSLAFLQARHDCLPPDFVMSVNISAKEFSRPGLEERVRNLLTRYQVDPKQIEFEITESVLMHDIRHCESVVYGLHGLGVKLALDDFGTGYSSLSYIMHLPFDVIKIDQSFTHNMLHNTRAKAVLKTVLELCQQLSLTNVVEGVETAEQLALLQQFSCNQVQGYLVSPPMIKAEFIQFMKTFKGL